MFKFAVLLACAAAVFALPPWVGKIHKPMPDGRIVGGDDANIEDYPYQVSLLYYGSHICGGSIISENYVVTAAHCTDGASASLLSIRTGSSILEEGGEVISVKTINQNPKFDYYNIDYDISILELASNITLGEGSQPIKVIDANTTLAAGVEVNVTGWGTLHPGDYNLPEQLQVVTVPIVSNEDCNTAYSSYGGITDRMLCAGLTQGGKDACQGDSGGPLVADGALAGIVSWGYSCAVAGYPGVYSNVTALRDFVTEITGL